MRRDVIFGWLFMLVMTSTRVFADGAPVAPPPAAPPLGTFSGIGAILGEKNGLPAVTEILPFGPAASSGLQTDDVVVRVDYRDMKGVKLADVVNLIRGEAGTTVVITVHHAGDSALHDFTIKRAPVTVGP